MAHILYELGFHHARFLGTLFGDEQFLFGDEQLFVLLGDGFLRCPEFSVEQMFTIEEYGAENQQNNKQDDDALFVG